MTGYMNSAGDPERGGASGLQPAQNPAMDRTTNIYFIVLYSNLKKKKHLMTLKYVVFCIMKYILHHFLIFLRCILCWMFFNLHITLNIFLGGMLLFVLFFSGLATMNASCCNFMTCISLKSSASVKDIWRWSGRTLLWSHRECSSAGCCNFDACKLAQGELKRYWDSSKIRGCLTLLIAENERQLPYPSSPV